MFKGANMLPKSGTSPSALLNELRSFMAQRRRAPLPAFLPTDTPLVLRGRKHLLNSSHSSLTFSCTGCGSCCRSYSSTVLIDPRDVSVMRLPPKAGHTSVSQQYPENFVHRVGLFTLEALTHLTPAVKVGSVLHGLPITRSRGTAPIVFLRALQGASGERCSFALEGKSGGGLTCSLGPERMPLSCALYPLGYFMPTDGQDSFYSVDTRGCEGLSSGEQPVATATTTVQKYLDTRGLGPRVANASWYQSLATAWACSGIEYLAEGVTEPIKALRHRLVIQGISPPSWLHDPKEEGMASNLGPPPLLIALRQAIRNVWYENGVDWSTELEEGMERRTKVVYEEAVKVIKIANL